MAIRRTTTRNSIAMRNWKSLTTSVGSITAKSAVLVSFAITAFATGVIFNPDAAHADLRVCNKSESRVDISIGYNGDRGWTTEGWWNLDPGVCEVILPGDLKSQYYYVYATDSQGGDWNGKVYMCTANKVFTIHGIKDCLPRGFQKTGFREINTGTQTSWTIQLTEETKRGTGGK